MHLLASTSRRWCAPPSPHVPLNSPPRPVPPALLSSPREIQNECCCCRRCTPFCSRTKSYQSVVDTAPIAFISPFDSRTSSKYSTITEHSKSSIGGQGSSCQVLIACSSNSQWMELLPSAIVSVHAHASVHATSQAMHVPLSPMKYR